MIVSTTMTNQASAPTAKGMKRSHVFKQSVEDYVESFAPVRGGAMATAMKYLTSFSFIYVGAMSSMLLRSRSLRRHC